MPEMHWRQDEFTYNACGPFTKKLLCDKAFNITKNPKYDGYQRGLVSMLYKFFDKKTSGKVLKNELMSNKELVMPIKN